MRVLPLGIFLVLAACSSATDPDRKVNPDESVAVQSSCAAPPAASSTSVVLEYDRPYSVPDGQPQYLDIARPATAGSYPLVVLIHGGSWSGGSRTNMRTDLLDFARRGYVAASVDYRLASAPTNVFPAAVRDVRCAVRWLRQNHAAHAIDTSRVAAAGFSAGAHLASMLGVNPTDASLGGDCIVTNTDASVDAVISYAGPQDLRVNGPYTEQQAAIVTNFLGVFPGDNPELAALASPIMAVQSGVAPFLLIHGTSDALVPIDQSRSMRDAVRSAGGKATLIELSRVPHAYVGLGASSRDEVRCTSVAFLERWLSN